ncbi:hypothetical protein BO86DRAFT_392045 [Aspergillus japonicus CBS 114.51]|uniref:Uncharacterized protein n=1 Tax=Aspergillus japonicus CBS 114.51 TaxID=1448312 RepID=A0A8T8WRB3_ASPJA|nr:hypothetical protein BO86DRAFT_392045 [Aspergillus japonicus CBS 114.51]RAH78223.1 hypothetical protein BO86DRAFT_392045 [Aspergillus japonicus CBS 114.51]
MTLCCRDEGAILFIVPWLLRSGVIEHILRVFLTSRTRRSLIIGDKQHFELN